MRTLAFAIGLLAASPSLAQVTNPPVGSSSGVDSATVQGMIASAIAADTTHATASALSTVQASIPTPALTVPGMEIPGGAAGTAGTYRTGTAVQPRITRVVSCVTASDGTCTGDWSPNPLPAVPGILPIPPLASGAAQGTWCWPIAGQVTVNNAKILCKTSQTVTVSILGATVAPLMTAAAGITVTIFAIPFS